MRTKRIKLIPKRGRMQIVAEGLGERGQTPVIAVITVDKNNVQASLAQPAVRLKLGLRDRPTA